MIKLFFIFTAVSAFDCLQYVRLIEEEYDVIPKDERDMYVPKLCSTTSLCHASPVLSSFDGYAFDVEQCYKSRMFNLDTNIFELVRANVTAYIQARERRVDAAARYDALNYETKDAMVSIIDICRLRDSYLREFKYSKPPILTGDIALLLEHNRRTYDVNSNYQLTNIRDILNITSAHVSSAKKWQTRLGDAYDELKAALANVATKKKTFESVVVQIKKNVVDSLLKIMN